VRLTDSIEKLRTKAVKRIAYGVLAVLFVVDILFIPRHETHFFVDNIRGFWSVFGFIACVLIIVLSKWIGHHGIMKDEEYYDK
jgi:hypothetical protein